MDHELSFRKQVVVVVVGNVYRVSWLVDERHGGQRVSHVYDNCESFKG